MIINVLEVHDDDLFTPAEVARMFRVNPKTVTRWAKQKRMTSIMTLGGHRRFYGAELKKMMDDSRVPRVIPDGERQGRPRRRS